MVTTGKDLCNTAYWMIRLFQFALATLLLILCLRSVNMMLLWLQNNFSLRSSLKEALNRI